MKVMISFIKSTKSKVFLGHSITDVYIYIFPILFFHTREVFSMLSRLRIILMTLSNGSKHLRMDDLWLHTKDIKNGKKKFLIYVNGTINVRRRINVVVTSLTKMQHRLMRITITFTYIPSFRLVLSLGT